MSLILPNLDDRKFQDIVDEAKQRIPTHCREWTDHNVSDPGVTLIELFAWMTDLLLYRLNRVPERHYVAFMKMLGICLGEPVAAKVPVTFWLTKGLKPRNPITSDPADPIKTIPAGTEVATTQTETERSVIFSTDQDFEIRPPELIHVFSRKGGIDRPQDLDNLRLGHSEEKREKGQWPAIFSDRPVRGDALYFGFESDLSGHILRFELEFDPAAAQGSGAKPPCYWEASTGNLDGERWQRCKVEEDTTEGMNQPGRILLHVPKMGEYRRNQTKCYWIRARVEIDTNTVQADIPQEFKVAGIFPFTDTPRLGKITSITSWGATIMTTNSQRVSDEFIGTSDGTPGQSFQLQRTHLLKREKGEHLRVEVGEQPEDWQEVCDFANSGPDDCHYTLDSATGELRFGPVIRQQDGELKMYGKIPPRSATLIFTQYRVGNGAAGNVRIGDINTLKTSIPTVARVANREQPVERGLDPESLDEAMMRAPGLLRSRERAVTCADFKFLVTHHREFIGRFARVECVQPRPLPDSNIASPPVYLLVIPKVDEPAGHLSNEMLEPEADQLEAVRAFLDERRLLTARLRVQPPDYRFVSARVRVQVTSPTDQPQVQEEILKRLYRFLNPLTGGEEGQGWPVDRALFPADIYAHLQGITGVRAILGVDIFAVNNSDSFARNRDQPTPMIEISNTHGLIASGRHDVKFE